MTIPSDEEDLFTVRKGQDRKLILLFYVLFSASAVVGISQTLGEDWEGFAYPLHSLLESLMFSFFFIGIIVYLMRYKRGYIRNLSTTLGVGFVCLIISYVIVWLDKMGYPITFYFRPSMQDIFILDVSSTFLTVAANFLWAYIICFGVIGVSCAFLRATIPRLFAFVERMDLTEYDWRNRMVVASFSLPTIVDYHKVEVGPVPSHQTFPYRELRRNFLLILYFAILIPSYVLLNPLFLQQSDTVDVVSLAMGASLFIPVLVLPFSSVIDTKARALNLGRDFDLGRGFRRTVMGFVGWGTLILLFVLTTQSRSLEDIAAMYSLYMFVAVAVAMIYIYVYYNYFQNDLVNDIVRSFHDISGRH